MLVVEVRFLTGQQLPTAGGFLELSWFRTCLKVERFRRLGWVEGLEFLAFRGSGCLTSKSDNYD